MNIRSRQHFPFSLALVSLLFIVFGGNIGYAIVAKDIDYDKLEKEVASLELGLGGYHIAKKMTLGQKEKAEETILSKSYPGTYTFSDDDVFVLVEKKRDIILAVYLKNEEAGKKELQRMIAELMGEFGNPTNEAHDQIIYWVYNVKGKISDEDYDNLQPEEHKNILATVKFQSQLTFSELEMSGDQKNSIYCIVAAPRMVKQFYRQ